MTTNWLILNHSGFSTISPLINGKSINKSSKITIHTRTQMIHLNTYLDIPKELMVLSIHHKLFIKLIMILIFHVHLKGV